MRNCSFTDQIWITLKIIWSKARWVKCEMWQGILTRAVFSLYLFLCISLLSKISLSAVILLLNLKTTDFSSPFWLSVENYPSFPCFCIFSNWKLIIARMSTFHLCIIVLESLSFFHPEICPLYFLPLNDLPLGLYRTSPILQHLEVLQILWWPAALHTDEDFRF